MVAALGSAHDVDETILTVTGHGFDSIPTLSFARWLGGESDRREFADEVRRTLHEVGFMRLVDHGVDPAFIADYFATMRAFFALDDDTKATIDKARSPWFRGWERTGTEYTDARIDHREQVDFWTELPPRHGDIEPAYLRLEGPNQWPDEVLPSFRPLVERFQVEMGTLADELMAAMSLGLGLPVDGLGERFGTRRMSLTKLIHYPPTPPGQAGVNGHHDTGFVTLLWQHGVGGLQVQNPAGAWIDVPADDGAIVVNIGEMLQAMTENYFVATTHRVVSAQERYSSAYFHGPDLSTLLEPIELDPRFTDAVAASAHHATAGFMARPDELARGDRGTTSAAATTYGEQLWNYFQRSYPDLVACSLAEASDHERRGAVSGASRDDVHSPPH